MGNRIGVFGCGCVAEASFLFHRQCVYRIHWEPTAHEPCIQTGNPTERRCGWRALRLTDIWRLCRFPCVISQGRRNQPAFQWYGARVLCYVGLGTRRFPGHPCQNYSAYPRSVLAVPTTCGYMMPGEVRTVRGTRVPSRRGSMTLHNFVCEGLGYRIRRATHSDTRLCGTGAYTAVLSLPST